MVDQRLGSHTADTQAAKVAVVCTLGPIKGLPWGTKTDLRPVKLDSILRHL